MTETYDEKRDLYLGYSAPRIRGEDGEIVVSAVAEDPAEADEIHEENCSSDVDISGIDSGNSVIKVRMEIMTTMDPKSQRIRRHPAPIQR